MSCSTGGGCAKRRAGNAIKLARTPSYLELLDRFAHSSLQASGEQVGLPKGQMGNSEVGHITMGAGRVVYQDLTRIDKSVSDGDFFEKPALVDAMTRCEGDEHALHLVGLVSPNGIHSHTRHLNALIEMAARHKLQRVFVQGFTDGRDTSPAGGAGFFGELEQVMNTAGTGRVASVGGRYYGMDRDNRWERTKKAYDSMVSGQGPRSRSAVEYIRKSYEAGVSDEFIEPGTIVDADDQPIGLIREGDSVIFFNFRSDRARQLTRALALEEFDGFERNPHPTIAHDDDDAVRPDVHLSGRVPAAVVERIVCRSDRRAEHDEPPRRGDGEVSARELLLQLRDREAVSRRRSHSRSVAEGCDLRPAARNERQRALPTTS